MTGKIRLPLTREHTALSIDLLGPLQVCVRGEPLPPLRSRKGQWLLALLALRDGREVQREWLADTLWPDSLTEEAFASLRQSLADLRRALGAEAVRLQSPTSRVLRLELSGAAVDALAFDAAIARGDPASLEQAVFLYRGPLLEGCAEAWALPEREVREGAYLQALETLAAAAMAAGDPAAAASWLRRGAGVDPLRQTLHQALMGALGAAGQYQAAIDAYHTLRHRLRREFNAGPEAETQALYQQLRAEAREKAAVRRQASGNRSGKGKGEPGSSPPSPADRASDAWRLRVPAKRAEAPPHNLPVPPTRIIGRERELAQLRALLGRAVGRQPSAVSEDQPVPTDSRQPTADSPRLVTLMGPGGTGKTRLGLQAAADRIGAFADGVFFVSLAPIRDAEQVAAAIARALGIREAPDRPLRESLTEYLRGREMLLLLDNFEQVLDAAPLVAELLAAAPRLKVLVTSRAALRLRGEQEFPVPPLAVPVVSGQWPVVSKDHASGLATDHWPLATVAACPSVRLFVERVAAARSDFAVSAGNAAAVAQICVRLEGLPLALELAAARMKLLSPEVLLARLERRLLLLTGGARDLPARQQTLRATIAWSYDLLDAGDQALFRRLSVFAGGFSQEAAEAVNVAVGCQPSAVGKHWSGFADSRWLTADSVPLGVLDRLALLMDNSLLRREEKEDGRQPRFVMLETIREYGLEVLEASGELEAIRGRHAGFYLALAETAEPELTGPAQAEWLARLDAEYGNLSAALEWCLKAVGSGQWIVDSPTEARAGVKRFSPELTTDHNPLSTAVEMGLRLAGALGRFWQIRGSFAEGRERLSRALSLSEAAGRPPRGATGDTGMIPAEARGLARTRAKALSWAGYLAVYQGDYEEARSLSEKSLALWREVGDPKGIAGTLGCLAIIAKDQGNRRTAAALFHESLALWREAGDRTGIAGTLGYLGILAADEGDAAARSFYTESLALRRERRDPWGIAASLNNLGLLALREGDFTAARALLAESLQIRRQLGDKRCMVISLNNLGLAACGQGDAETARAFLEESLMLARAIGDRRSIAYSYEAFARLSVLEGESGLLAGLPPRSAAHAALLGGAAAALREAIGAPLPPADRAQYEPTVIAARAALGEERFAVAWAEGRNMALEEAAGYALEGEAGSSLWHGADAGRGGR